MWEPWPRSPRKIPHKKIREVNNEHGSFGYYECEDCSQKGFTRAELDEKSCF
jgi:hypothetical protein